ncbi:MAG TPA: ABC transporter permease [Planctomycetota bacterium]|nr:ABC transporter permease [Planctomycetota bacterium]
MKFVLMNVLRRKARTLFSVLGVGLGISIMVALFTISDDIINQFRQMLQTQRGDIIVSQGNVDEIESRVETRYVERLKELKGVKNVTPMIMAFLRTEGNFGQSPAILYYGITEDNPIVRHMEMVQGKPISDADPNGVVFGETAYRIVQEKLEKDKQLGIDKPLSLTDLIQSPGFAQIFGKPDNWDKLNDFQKFQWVTGRLKKLGIHPDATATETDEEYLKRTGKDPKVWLRRADETDQEYRDRTRALDTVAFPRGVDPAGDIGMKQNRLQLTVRGVCRTGVAIQDAAVYFHMRAAQLVKGMHERVDEERVLDDKGKPVRGEDGKFLVNRFPRPAMASFLVVEVDDPKDKEAIAALCTQISGDVDEFKNLRATPSSEVLDRYSEINLIEKFGWVVSIIAALAGALGVLNIMMMAVLERTREIGLMLAIGWPKSRVLLLVIAEGMVISVLGGVVGVGFGYAETLVARDYLNLDGLSGELNLERSLQALGLAFVIGFLASLYPAWRASRLTPIDALRQE